MKNWAQIIGLLIICCQMVGCGGTDAKASSSSSQLADKASSQPKGAEVAEAKVVSDTYNTARALWLNTAPANYHYSYKEGGAGYKFDAYSPVTIWVRDGQISQVVSGIQVLRVEDYQQASIEQIFARLAYTISHSQMETRVYVDYDPILGFPSLVKITPSCCSVATQMTVTDLQIDP